MLSIRTQDRMALVPYDQRILIEEKNGFRLILGYDWTTNLGTYESKERTLEVLDEITKAVCNSNLTRYEYFNGTLAQLLEYSFKDISVYVMPKE